MIRPVTVDEVDLLLPLGEEFYADSKLPGKFDPVTFSNVLKAIVIGGIPTLHGILYGAFNEQGKLIGSIGGIVFIDLLTGDRVAQENFWFMSKEHRGGTDGIRLLAAFEDRAVELGAKRINMIHLQSLNADKLPHIYNRRGYTLTEQLYCKEIS